MSKLDASVFSRLFAQGTQGDFTAIWCSNQLSNLSNALYSCSASKSNTTSSECPQWSFESNNPLATSNTGTLPRFVYNSNDDQTFYIDCKGTAVPLQGYRLSNIDNGCWLWTSNSVALLSNLTSSNGSFLMTLSNLWNLSNVLNNYAAWSNTSTWASNNFSNLCCPEWTSQSSNPTSRSNTGTLPRFVYNSNDDTTWYVDCKGLSIPLNGFKTTLGVNSVVIAFKSNADLNNVQNPQVGDSYIILDGEHQSDIATWNGSIWTYYSPYDKETATVTTTSGTYTSGSYTYNALEDVWYLTSGSTALIEDGSPSTTCIVGNVALTSQDELLHLRVGGPCLILDDKIITWERGDGVFNAGSTNGGNYYPHTIPFNWSELMLYTNIPPTLNPPVFVDAAIQNQFVLALDSRGKVWTTALNRTTLGIGLTIPTSSNTYVDIIPRYGFSPVTFFHEKNITIKKLYVGGYQGVQNSAALATNGDVYVAGDNSYGQLGQGFLDSVNNTYKWYKYPLGNVKNMLVRQLCIFAHTNDNKLYMTGRDLSGFMRGSLPTVDRTTPWLVMSDVATFSITSLHSVYIVKTDGTLWVAGSNYSGQLGINSLALQYGFVQVPGITNASSVVPQTHENFGGSGGGRYACLIRKDRTISFAGVNMHGEFGYELHLTNNSGLNTAKVFVTPTAPFQGRVKKVVLGYSQSQVLTTDGELYNAGQPKYRGIGRQQTPDPVWGGIGWWVLNSFVKVPIPDPVACFRMFTGQGLQTTDGTWEGSNPYPDATVVLTTRGRVYVYGGNQAITRWNIGRGNGTAPSMVPILHLSDGIPVALPPK